MSSVVYETEVKRLLDLGILSFVNSLICQKTINLEGLCNTTDV